MAILTTKQATFAGVDLAPVAASAGGDKVLNDGNVKLFIENGSGATITVTVQAPGKPGGLTITNPTIPIPAGKKFLGGPYDPAYFNDASGFLNLTYSGVTSLTISPFKD